MGDVANGMCDVGSVVSVSNSAVEMADADLLHDRMECKVGVERRGAISRHCRTLILQNEVEDLTESLWRDAVHDGVLRCREMEDSRGLMVEFSRWSLSREGTQVQAEGEIDHDAFGDGWECK